MDFAEAAAQRSEVIEGLRSSLKQAQQLASDLAEELHRTQEELETAREEADVAKEEAAQAAAAAAAGGWGEGDGSDGSDGDEGVLLAHDFDDDYGHATPPSLLDAQAPSWLRDAQSFDEDDDRYSGAFQPVEERIARLVADASAHR